MLVEILVYNDINKQVPVDTRRILTSRFSDLITFLCHDYKITLSNNLEETIGKSTAEYVLVISLGNHFSGPNAIQEMVEFAQAEKTPLVAHILNQDSLYLIDPQWFIINTNVYKKIGCPRIRPHYQDKRSLIMLPSRSRENVHHNYTPLWIKPQKNYEMTTIPGHFFGTFLLDGLLNAGYTIKNVPEHIRYKKAYCYPTENWQQIIKCIDDRNFKPSHGNVERFFAKINENLDNVYSDLGYYPINTENIYPFNYNNIIKSNYNFFAGVCSGLKPIILTGSKSFDEESTVVLFDRSQAALDWYQFLYNNWNGDLDSYESLNISYNNKQQKSKPIFNKFMDFNAVLQDNITNAGIDKNELKQCWLKFKRHKVYFEKIDLLDENSVSKLCGYMTSPNVQAYLWLSNCFNMDWQMIYHGKKYMQKKLGYITNFIKQNTAANLVIEHDTVLTVVR